LVRRQFLSVAASATVLLAVAPLAAAEAKRTPSIKALARAFVPGAYAWQPERAPAGPVEVVVSLPKQLAYVYRSGKLIGASTISSGKAGHESPIGRFHILEKRAVHRSNRHDDAPMPFMQRLNWFGVALHGGEIPGHPASHGCIRLPMAFAEKLFGATELGSYVFIADEELRSPKAALKLARANAAAPIGPDRSPAAAASR
jgi:hypothetical protein